jgi:SAM-dependent methyltransferase
MKSENLDEKYWDKRYENGETGWDIGYPSTPIKTYIDQIENKHLKILIPGAGNSYEAIYLLENNFTNVTVCDISFYPLEKLEKYAALKLLHQNFFDINDHYDLVIEQTFFCALPRIYRIEYVKKMYSILQNKGKLVGVLFNKEFDIEGPPFGGTEDEYKKLFESYFEFKVFEKCYNSIPPRSNSELFINIIKK